MRIVDRLKQDHAELRRLADELTRLLASPEPPDAAELADCRWSLARQVTRHLALEDQHVYKPLGASAGPGAAMVRRLRQELGDLYMTYQRHIAAWSGEAVARDWPGYCRATGALIKALHVRMDREEAHLYPLVPETRRNAA